MVRRRAERQRQVGGRTAGAFEPLPVNEQESGRGQSRSQGEDEGTAAFSCIHGVFLPRWFCRLPAASVSSITTEDRHFEWIPDTVEGLPEGLYEVIGDSREKIYKHVAKRLQTSSQNMNGNPIGYVDPGYRTEVNDYYAISKTYYFKDGDGRFSRVKGRSALLRKFPERRGELRKALSAAGYDVPGIDFDAYCKMVLNLVAR